MFSAEPVLCNMKSCGRIAPASIHKENDQSTSLKVYLCVKIKDKIAAAPMMYLAGKVSIFSRMDLAYFTDMRYTT